MVADFLSNPRNPVNPNRWFWVLFCLEAVSGLMVLAGLGYNHLWKVAFQQILCLFLVFGLAFSLRRLSQDLDISAKARDAVLLGGVFVLVIGIFNAMLLIQYDVALGHLCR